MAPLQFAPWTSNIELAFYITLSNLKINHDKLDDSARRILGLYTIRPNERKELSAHMQILANALRSDE
jgi:ubiquitin-like modifier-activating enzyme ATG7